MDKGAWQAIVHGISRVGHDLAHLEKSLKDALKLIG